MSQGPPATLRALVARHWRDSGFWRWFWRERLPLGAKISFLCLAFFGLAAGGVLGAVSLDSGSSSTGTKSVLVPAVSTGNLRGRARPQIQTLAEVRTSYITKPQTVTNVQTIVNQRTVTAAQSSPATVVKTLTKTVVKTQTETVIVTQPATQTVTVTAPVSSVP